VRALKPFLTLVNFIMFIEVSFLCEAVLTVRVRTAVRPLVSVNAEVIKEVMPFFKVLPAI